jgi:hypothetical protein
MEFNSPETRVNVPLIENFTAGQWKDYFEACYFFSFVVESKNFMNSLANARATHALL